MAQQPSVGKKVAKGSAIEIALSQGPKVSAVANLINTIYEADVPALEPYGWDIRLVEEYNSQEPYHKVLAQDPAPGFQLAAGQPLTLMVSGGTTVTLGVNIDNQILLDAANLPRDQVQARRAVGRDVVVARTASNQYALHRVHSFCRAGWPDCQSD